MLPLITDPEHLLFVPTMMAHAEAWVQRQGKQANTLTLPYRQQALRDVLQGIGYTAQREWLCLARAGGQQEVSPC